MFGINDEYLPVINETRNWAINVPWLAAYAAQSHSVSHGTIYAGEPLFTRYESECVHLLTGETVTIPAGVAVASLTDDMVCGSPAYAGDHDCGCIRLGNETRAPFHLIAHLGDVYVMRHGVAQPFRHVSGRFTKDSPALTSSAMSAHLAEWVRTSAHMRTSKADYAHDVAVVLQAFIRGTFRHAWGDQWDTYAGDIRKAISAYAPWPTDWDDAVARVALMRLAQSGDTGGLPADSQMWGVALRGWTVPGTGESYIPDTSNDPWVSAYDAIGAGLLAMSADELAEAVIAQRSRRAQAFGAFAAAWREMWDVLDIAADREEWCGEYEQTSERISELVRTRGLTFAERNSERTYHVWGNADVSVTLDINLPVSTTMAASNTDELHIDPCDAADTLDLDSWASDLAYRVRRAGDDRQALAIMRDALRVSDVRVDGTYVDDWEQADY